MQLVLPASGHHCPLHRGAARPSGQGELSWGVRGVNTRPGSVAAILLLEGTRLKGQNPEGLLTLHLLTNIFSSFSSRPYYVSGTIKIKREKAGKLLFTLMGQELC